MSSESTYLEHDLVNLLASLTLRMPDCPPIFFETGYRVEFFEKEFDANIDGRKQEVKFDLILNNKYQNHSLAFECKSGGVDPQQLEKYSKVKSDELVLVGGVSSDKPSSHSHDVSIVFNDVNTSKVLPKTTVFDFVNISVGRTPTSIKVIGRSFQDDNLEAYFSTSIPCPEHIFEVFQVGGQTCVEKYIRLMAQELVAISIAGKDRFTIDDLAPKITSPYTDFYPSRIGLQLRKDIIRKIEKALILGSRYELRDYFSWNSPTKIGELKKIKPGCKPMSYRAFKEEASVLAERIRKGDPPPEKYIRRAERTSPQQEILLSEDKEEKGKE